METPSVLLLAFNRPDLARKVFAAIRAAQPARLFIAVDGARKQKLGEAALVAETRNLAHLVDWPCEVHTRFLEENLGCKQAVSTAIDWFFEHVEEGVILEDDCLPHPSFFPYCAAMLARYRDDERVGMVSGDNFRPQAEWRGSGHEFSIFTFIWGWATWRRAWRRFDRDLSDWPERKREGWLRGVLGRADAAEHWTQIFDRCHSGLLDTWAYPWSYSCWRAGFLCVVPACNLVSNIGFDERGTDTSNSSSPNARLPVREISAPWDEAPAPRRDRAQEVRYLRGVYGVRLFNWRKRMRLAVRAWRGRLARRLDLWTLPLAGRRSRARRMVNLLKEAERFVPGRTTLDGVTWSYPDAVSFAHAYDQIFLRGIYEIGAGDAAPRIVDCGPNIGLATLYWKIRYPRAEVVAVEADPAIHAYLADNLARSGATGVRALNQAVWHSLGELVFAPQGADGGSLVGDAGAAPARTIRVPAVPLGELLGDGPVDLLKMDIEGAECDVLAGQDAALARVKRVFVEYHSYAKKPQRLDELLALFRRAGFRVQIHPELISPRPFVARADEDGMDHRLNIYAWRE